MLTKITKKSFVWISKYWSVRHEFEGETFEGLILSEKDIPRGLFLYQCQRTRKCGYHAYVSMRLSKIDNFLCFRANTSILCQVNFSFTSLIWQDLSWQEFVIDKANKDSLFASFMWVILSHECVAQWWVIQESSRTRKCGFYLIFNPRLLVSRARHFSFLTEPIIRWQQVVLIPWVEELPDSNWALVPSSNCPRLGLGWQSYQGTFRQVRKNEGAFRFKLFMVVLMVSLHKAEPKLLRAMHRVRVTEEELK